MTITTPAPPAATPPRNDNRNDTAATCPACGQPFTPAGRRRWCSDACRQAAWRQRHPAPDPAALPPRYRPGTPPSTSAPDATSATSASSDARTAQRSAAASGPAGPARTATSQSLSKTS